MSKLPDGPEPWSKDPSFKIEKEVTLKEFDALVEEYAEARSCRDNIKSELKKSQEIVDEMEAKLLALLEANDKQFYETPKAAIYTSKKMSVKLPQGEDRKAFFDYLKERNMFEEMATINSNTLNAFYKTEFEEAVQKGVYDFAIPGIAQPNYYNQLSLKRTKK